MSGADGGAAQSLKSMIWNIVMTPIFSLEFFSWLSEVFGIENTSALLNDRCWTELKLLESFSEQQQRWCRRPPEQEGNRRRRDLVQAALLADQQLGSVLDSGVSDVIL